MPKYAIVAAGLLLSIVLGATVFREPIAWAAQSLDATIVGPLDSGNVRVHEEGTATVSVANSTLPVREQNVDARGFIKTHEQGTADVNVTNASLVTTAAPVTGGGGKLLMGAGVPLVHTFDPPVTATALSISFHAEAGALTFTYQGSVVADFWGPHFFGANTVALALSRPITFDQVECHISGGATDTCNVSWVGNQP